VVLQIQQLSELVTVKYTMQKAIGLKEQKVPFGSESILLLVQANVSAGVDLSAITSNDVRVADDRSVTIRLPDPRILSVSVDERETKVWDRNQSWWIPWEKPSPDLEQRARIAALETVQAAALEQGILRDARSNTTKVLVDILTALGFRSVSVE
jgi:hypothetical protein